ITFNQIKTSASNYFNIISSDYDSSYSTTFQICKNPCLVNSQEEMIISPTEISALQRWLCRKNQFYRLKIDQTDYEHLYWNATFTSKQITLNGNIIGMELTPYTDAPFAYMDEVVIEEKCTENSSFDIYDVSDEEGYIYPNLTIHLQENGEFILSNKFGNNIISKMSIANCSQDEIITIDGRNQIISTSCSTHTTLPKDFNYFFPKIFNTYAESKNTFTCNLKCKITISYSPVRKVGL
ncbi:MAG: hypothetical protein K2M60_08690, partial [Lachnospiraceae bacterium]|nr:hypothetical protein [Lachnospiraceae bacterium]